MTSAKRGYALIIAIIITSMMLSFGMTLGSLAYKQQVLTSGAIESQYAFYIADAALECALYADQQQGLFDYAMHDANNPPGLITCNNQPGILLGVPIFNSASPTPYLQVTDRLSMSANRCADVTVLKYQTGQTDIYSQGYDVSCDTLNTAEQNPNNAMRIVARGIRVSI